MTIYELDVVNRQLSKLDTIIDLLTQCNDLGSVDRDGLVSILEEIRQGIDIMKE